MDSLSGLQLVPPSIWSAKEYARDLAINMIERTQEEIRDQDPRSNESTPLSVATNSSPYA